MPITHNFVSAKSDSADLTIIQPSYWNDDHSIDFLGTVRLTHNNANGTDNSWYANAPDGSSIDITASATDGFQEVITYAALHGYNIDVIGGTAINGTSSVISCTVPIVVPPMQNCFFRVWGCTIDFTAAIGSSPAVTFNSLMMMNISWGATQVVNDGSGPTIFFSPTSNLPVDVRTVITASHIYIHSIVNIHSPAADVANVPLVKFDISAYPINENEFIFNELNAGGCAITVTNSPTGTTAVFRGNYIRCMAVHDQTGTTLPIIQLGQTAMVDPTDFTCLENIWDLSIQNSVATKKAIKLFASCETIRCNVIQLISNIGVAVYFESTADLNQIIAGRLQGAAGAAGLTTFSVDGTQNQNIVLCRHPKGNSAITLTGSPFVYHNVDFTPNWITINAGTVTDVQISADGITYSSTQSTSNIFIHLDAGMYLKIVYSSAPTVRKIY